MSGNGGFMVNLKAKPFYLSERREDWVYETLASMSTEEKIGQMFCPIGGNTEEKYLREFLDEFHPGAMLYRPFPAREVQKTFRFLQEHSKIPLLFAANLESGGNGICSDGTYFSRPMGVAAADSAKHAGRLGAIAGREARAVGCNWACAPICDLDLNPMNPITNVRTYGSDRERVIAFVKEQMRGLKECGLATAVKHFPGDGVDGRDQHLLSSVNSLSKEEWDASYGRIWREVVDAGTLSIMAGHILLPAYSRYLNPELADEEILPATLSKELLGGLLRGILGFEGVIVTDATPMVGFHAAMARRDALPTALAAGCDMLLFQKDIREDYRAIRDAVTLDEGETENSRSSDGRKVENSAGGKPAVRLSRERIDEAVTRILAMKAAIGLPEQQANGTLVPDERALGFVRCRKHLDWADECADESVTLVKDTQHLLPISPEKYRKIRLYLLEDRDDGGFKDGEGSIGIIKELLEREGFEVSLFDRAHPDFHEMFEGSVEELKQKFDLAVYVACLDTASNQTVRRIEWMHLMAADAPWFVHNIPVLFISVANPYHLVDVPMVKTYINAYTPTEAVIRQVIEKIMGRFEFKGKSPVDPFCGVWGTQF